MKGDLLDSPRRADQLSLAMTRMFPDTADRRPAPCLESCGNSFARLGHKATKPEGAMR
jgi:hypothetical protein